MSALGRPASAADVAAEIARATGLTVTSAVARRRLDTLVARGEARSARATAGRRRFLFQLTVRDESSSAYRSCPLLFAKRVDVGGRTWRASSAHENAWGRSRRRARGQAPRDRSHLATGPDAQWRAVCP